ncbi:hypothetical protein SADUNF_Sadunf07G0070900 [Salix dunnii]|uniref:Uncharacterized protein n=1 Tax=Salix dunnii TaxID=1413687 RepID=A0A835K3J8_9ROSI|nr:hypothetical protein SADUNF_Sadunf07G0070900 [Salix dunnii]
MKPRVEPKLAKSIKREFSETQSRARREQEPVEIFAKIRSNQGIMLDSFAYMREPLSRALKCNVDATVLEQSMAMEVGFVIKNHDQVVNCYESWKTIGLFTPIMAKVSALKNECLKNRFL